MKLRIKGSTIRLRLTQGEVDTFRDEGKVVDTTVFHTPGSASLRYVLESSEETKALQAYFENNTLLIKVPATVAGQWTGTEQVGFSNETEGAPLPVPYILVEKDFQCLHKRPHEDESDHFPNPMAGNNS